MWWNNHKALILSKEFQMAGSFAVILSLAASGILVRWFSTSGFKVETVDDIVWTDSIIQTANAKSSIQCGARCIGKTLKHCNAFQFIVDSDNCHLGFLDYLADTQGEPVKVNKKRVKRNKKNHFALDTIAFCTVLNPTKLFDKIEECNCPCRKQSSGGWSINVSRLTLLTFVGPGTLSGGLHNVHCNQPKVGKYVILQLKNDKMSHLQCSPLVWFKYSW